MSGIAAVCEDGSHTGDVGHAITRGSSSRKRHERGCAIFCGATGSAQMFHDEPNYSCRTDRRRAVRSMKATACSYSHER